MRCASGTEPSTGRSRARAASTGRLPATGGPSSSSRRPTAVPSPGAATTRVPLASCSSCTWTWPAGPSLVPPPTNRPTLGQRCASATISASRMWAMTTTSSAESAAAEASTLCRASPGSVSSSVPARSGLRALCSSAEITPVNKMGTPPRRTTAWVGSNGSPESRRTTLAATIGKRAAAARASSVSGPTLRSWLPGTMPPYPAESITATKSRPASSRLSGSGPHASPASRMRVCSPWPWARSSQAIRAMPPWLESASGSAVNRPQRSLVCRMVRVSAQTAPARPSSTASISAAPPTRCGGSNRPVLEQGIWRRVFLDGRNEPAPVASTGRCRRAGRPPGLLAAAASGRRDAVCGGLPAGRQPRLRRGNDGARI